MITEVFTTGAEYVAGLGVDVAKEHIHEKLDEKSFVPN